MYDHIGLKVKNVAAAARFYQAALEPLGHAVDESGTGFGPRGQPGLPITARRTTLLSSSTRTATTSKRCASRRRLRMRGCSSRTS